MSLSPLLHRLRRRGFTLLEFILVIVIIGVLTAYVLARVSGAREKAYVDAMKADLRRLAVLQESYLANGTTYASDPLTIPGFAWTTDVVLDASAGSANAWSATVSHAKTAVTCELAVGLALAESGRITCSNDPASAVTPNAAPTATFTATPATATTGQTVTFDATGSSDTDGTIASYTWDFAGTPGTGATATHAFSSAGNHTVTLTVTDDDGDTDTYSTTVTVSSPVVLEYTPGSMAVTSTRGGVASYRTASGTLAWAAGNVARDNHWVDGRRYLYLERSNVNNAYYSEDASQHTLTGLTAVTNDRAAPDGAATADKLVEDASTGEHHLQIVGSASGGVVSVFVRAAERSIVYLRTNPSGTPITSYFDVATGVVMSAGTMHYPLIEPWADGWYRVSISPGGVAGGRWVGVAAAAGASSYAGDGTSGVHVWGLQRDNNVGDPGSYIATPGAAAVVRSSDNASVPVSVPPQEMALYARFRHGRHPGLGHNGRLAVIGAGSPGARLELSGNWMAGWSLSANSIGVADGASRTSNSPYTGAAGQPDVEALVQLFADGSVQASAARDDGAPVVGPRSAAGPIPAAWATSARMTFGPYTSEEPMLLEAIKIATGVQTIPALR